MGSCNSSEKEDKHGLRMSTSVPPPPDATCGSIDIVVKLLHSICGSRMVSTVSFGRSMTGRGTKLRVPNTTTVGEVLAVVLTRAVQWCSVSLLSCAVGRSTIRNHHSQVGTSIWGAAAGPQRAAEGLQRQAGRLAVLRARSRATRPSLASCYVQCSADPPTGGCTPLQGLAQLKAAMQVFEGNCTKPRELERLLDPASTTAAQLKVSALSCLQIACANSLC